MKLVAIYPILYRSHQYEIGDTLPADDQSMVQAWLDAKTAMWQEEEMSGAKAKPVTAKPVTAQAGLTGQSPNGETADNVVGRVPKTPARNKGAKKNG